MITVEESDESKLNLKKSSDQLNDSDETGKKPGSKTVSQQNIQNNTNDKPFVQLGPKGTGLKIGSAPLKLGLNLGGKPTTAPEKPALQLRLGLSPGLKLSGLQSSTVLANKQQKAEESKKMYEENLTNLLKRYHKDYLKQNQIAIHKMIISENVV